ncbi:MAG: hypothetical protein FGM41_10275 [Bacteroidetes bacterium]|nr:hypothetical protein [Bacteroidota bacterium]
MLSLMQEKMRVLWWNFLFILLGVLLIGILHAYISQLVSFCVNKVSFIEEGDGSSFLSLLCPRFNLLSFIPFLFLCNLKN